MRKTALAFLIAAMSTPAFAQMADESLLRPNLAGETHSLKRDRDIKKEQEAEAGYKAGLNKIPDAQKSGKPDPWGSVRNAPATASSTNQSRASSK